MSTIEIFEASAPARRPADVTYDNFASRLRWLESKGVRVQRYTFPGDAGWSSINPTVKNAVEMQGPDCLPMLLVDGNVISVAGYPTPIELMEAVGSSIGIDPEFFGQIAMEAAALGATIATNDFQGFQQQWERLRSLGIRGAEAARAVQAATTIAGHAVQDEMRTRIEQLLAFGPRSKPPKPKCACGEKL